MTLPPIYSRRKQATQPKSDIYEYEDISPKLKVQVAQIIRDAFGPYWNSFGSKWQGSSAYDAVIKLLRRELGVHELASHNHRDPSSELIVWLQGRPHVDHWLDGVEMCLRLIDTNVRNSWPHFKSAGAVHPDRVIPELNARFQEAGFGYQFVGGDIVRMDNLVLHKDVVVPALTLLTEPRFAAADEEYRAAHEAHRNGRQEDCLVACAKSFESVLKVIGKKRNWPINENDPAAKLIQAAVTAGFLPSYSQASMNHLKGLLESSTPTIRNKMGGHGAGDTPREVPQHLAALQLHQTAAMILFLVQQDKALP